MFFILKSILERKEKVRTDAKEESQRDEFGCEGPAFNFLSLCRQAGRWEGGSSAVWQVGKLKLAPPSAPTASSISSFSDIIS